LVLNDHPFVDFGCFNARSCE